MDDVEDFKPRDEARNIELSSMVLLEWSEKLYTCLKFKKEVKTARNLIFDKDV